MKITKNKIQRITLALLLCTSATTCCWGMKLFKKVAKPVNGFISKTQDFCLEHDFFKKYKKRFIERFQKIKPYTDPANLECWTKEQKNELKEGQFSLELAELSFEVLLCKVNQRIVNDLAESGFMNERQSTKLINVAKKELEKAENKLKTAQKKHYRQTFSSISKALAAEKFLQKNMKQRKKRKQLELEKINKKLETPKSDAHSKYMRNHEKTINGLLEEFPNRLLLERFSAENLKLGAFDRTGLKEEAKNLFSSWKSEHVLPNLKSGTFNIKHVELIFEYYILVLENLLYDKVKIDKCVEEGLIEIVPFAFMRGRTFTNSLIILDEAQNVTMNQMEMMLGRLGKGSTMVICGDKAQIDLRNKKDSGFGFLYILEAQVKGFKVITLKTNHRHEIVEPVLKVYEDYR